MWLHWFCLDSLEFQIYEETWIVQHNTSVKCLKKCGIINALGGAEYDELLEESGSSNSNIINDDCTIMILWNFVTHGYFIVHYCFLE